TVLFFSSRRRHTRLVSDWSSDVCSSDLSGQGLDALLLTRFGVPERLRGFPDLRVGRGELRAARRRELAREPGPARDRRRRRGQEIGRASCRERGEDEGGGGCGEKT